MKLSNPGAKACASFALFLGLTTLIGWGFHIPGLVRWQPGMAPAVVNTGIGFVLGGLGLLVGSMKGRRSSIVSGVIGLLVAIVGIEELVVLAFDLSPAFSLPELHRPFQLDYPRPGRMGPNTALCFLLCGSGLVALAAGRSKWMMSGARAAAIAVGTLGLFGILGYTLQLEHLYEWTGAGRMSIQTGAGMIALGLALAAQAQTRQVRPHNTPNKEVADVYQTAALLLLLTASGAGIASFALLQVQVERQQRDLLSQATNDRIALIALEIANRSASAEMASSDNLLAADLPSLCAGHAEQTAIAALRDWARTLRSKGFSYIAVDAGGQHVALYGTARRPELAVRIAGTHPGQLLWNQGFVLRRTFAVCGGFDSASAIITEQPLVAMTATYEATNRLGETTEMAVCRGDVKVLHCFPLRSRPHPFDAPRAVAGPPLPIEYADRGQTGTVVALDYRQHRVLAGYGPIGDSGIGLVVKRDLAEIYAPIRQQFQRILFILAVLLGGGLWIMRRQLIPMLATLEVSRAEARAGLARAEAAMEGNLDAFFILESMRNGSDTIHDLRYTMMNAAGERMLRRPRTEAIGHGMCSLVPEFRSDGLLDACIEVVGSGNPRVLERRSVLREMLWYHMQLVKLGDGIGLTVRDITSAHLAAEVIRHQAMHDALTGVVNRAGLDVILDAALAQARDSGQMVALAMLDVDKFKDINDRLGHAAGDQLLVQTAARLKACVRPTDSVARLGGDEFVVLLLNITGSEGAEVVARKLVAQTAQPTVLDGQNIEVTISLGISVFPADGMTPDTLMRAADHAMYEAKRAGRNRYALSSTQRGSGQA
jgi:diguanylate cyclase (GGDEF)-like protein